MGELYKSLTRNMNLLPVANAIADYVKKKRQQEKMQEFLNLIQGSRRGMERNFDKIVKGKNEPYWDGGNQMNLPDLNFEEEPGINTTKRNSLASQLFDNGQTEGGAPQRPGIRMSEQPETEVLGDYSSSPEQIAGVNKDANRMLVDYMMKSLKFQGDDVAPEMKQQGANILQQIISGEQPGETEYKTFGKNVYEADGKINFEKPAYTIPTESKEEKVKTEFYEKDANGEVKIYTISGQKYMKRIKDNNGNKVSEKYERIPKKGEGSTNITNVIPPDYSNLEAKLTKSLDNYKHFQNIVDEEYAKIEKLRVKINELSDSDDDKKKKKSLKFEIEEIQEKVDKAQDDKEANFGDIKGYTNAEAVKWSSKEGFDGFNIMYKRLLSMINDPKKINETVERELKGNHPEVIMKMKELLRARIF